MGFIPDLGESFIAFAILLNAFSLFLIIPDDGKPKVKFLYCWILSALGTALWVAGYIVKGWLFCMILAVIFAFVTGAIFTAFIKAPKAISKKS